MSATELDAYMELTTFHVDETTPRGDKITWEIVVLGPQATLTTLNIIPDNGVIENEFKFIKDNYLIIAKDIVYPSIVKPKIPLERLTLPTTMLLFSVLRDACFPEGKGNEGEAEDGAAA